MQANDSLSFLFCTIYEDNRRNDYSVNFGFSTVPPYPEFRLSWQIVLNIHIIEFLGGSLLGIMVNDCHKPVAFFYAYGIVNDIRHWLHYI